MAPKPNNRLIFYRDHSTFFKSRDCYIYKRNVVIMVKRKHVKTVSQQDLDRQSAQEQIIIHRDNEQAVEATTCHFNNPASCQSSEIREPVFSLESKKRGCTF